MRVRMKLLPAWCVLFAVVMANQRVVVSGAGRALLQDSPLPLPETCPDGSTADGNGNCFTCENGAGLQFSESGECSCSDLNPCTSVPAVPSTDGDGEDGSAPAGENAPGMSDIHSHAFAFPCLDICLT